MNYRKKFLNICQIAGLIISPISGITSIAGFLYGFWWIRNHKIQQRIDNRSQEARKALDQLFEVKLLLKDFFENDNCERTDILNNRLPVLLNRLINTLFFIKNCKEVDELKITLKELLQIILSFSDNKNYKLICSKIKSLIYSPNNKSKLDDLKIILLEIYEMRR